MADNNNCLKWSAAEQLKCTAFSQCRFQDRQNVSKCVGAHRIMSASVFDTEYETPANVSFNSVGQCYENSLLFLRDCVAQANSAVSAAMQNVRVPTQEER